jgi:hypothetical protein
MSKVLIDFDGKDMKQSEKPLTLGIACATALGNALQGDDLKPEETVARWHLSVRLYGGGDQEMSPEQLTMVRARLAKVYPILIAGQAIEMLE